MSLLQHLAAAAVTRKNPVRKRESSPSVTRRRHGTRKTRDRRCGNCITPRSIKAEAIDFFLGADIGGRGSTLTTREDGDYRLWTVTAPDGNKTVVRINKKDANKY